MLTCVFCWPVNAKNLISGDDDSDFSADSSDWDDELRPAIEEWGSDEERGPDEERGSEQAGCRDWLDVVALGYIPSRYPI